MLSFKRDMGFCGKSMSPMLGCVTWRGAEVVPMSPSFHRAGIENGVVLAAWSGEHRERPELGSVLEIFARRDIYRGQSLHFRTALATEDV